MSGEFQSVDGEGKAEIKSCEVDESGNKRAPNDHEDSKTDAELDAAIEDAAKRRNLSTLNVKSIIHVRHNIIIIVLRIILELRRSRLNPQFIVTSWIFRFSH
jgi:hypothetical protein